MFTLPVKTYVFENIIGKRDTITNSKIMFRN